MATDLGQKLFNRAKDYAAKRKAVFGPGAREDIRRFAYVAAEELKRIGAENDESRIRAAVLPFETLIDRMIFEKTKRQEFRGNVGEIGEHTLSAALKFLCPLFPFC
jgi:hypothetical protein